MPGVVDRRKHEAGAVRGNTIVLHQKTRQQALALSCFEIRGPKLPAHEAAVCAGAQQIVKFPTVRGEVREGRVTLRSDLPLATRVMDPQRSLPRTHRSHK